MAYIDYYNILGVSKDASQEDIKKGFSRSWLAVSSGF